MKRYRMTVRGTRIVLEIILCTDIPMDEEAFKDQTISAINIFSARVAEGDHLIDPDPWYAPVVEGRDCGVSVLSGREQTTMTWKVGVDALLGLFKFYTTVKKYTSSKTLVIDTTLPESEWHVGIIVIGPLDLK